MQRLATRIAPPQVRMGLLRSRIRAGDPVLTDLGMVRNVT